MATQVEKRLFTVDEFHKMAEAEILAEDERVELIDGELVRMSAVGRRHIFCVTELTWTLSRRLREGMRLSVQNPVRLNEYWEPEPDLVVLRSRTREVPNSADVLLVIEVAEVSLLYD